MSDSIRVVSRHSSIYRGFIITRRPKTGISKVARYEVTLGEQSFGLFDTQTQATGYIDGLLHMNAMRLNNLHLTKTLADSNKISSEMKMDNTKQTNNTIPNCQKLYLHGAHAGNIHYTIDTWGMNSLEREAVIKKQLDDFISGLNVNWKGLQVDKI